MADQSSKMAVTIIWVYIAFLEVMVHFAIFLTKKLKKKLFIFSLLYFKLISFTKLITVLFACHTETRNRKGNDRSPENQQVIYV